MADFLKIQCKGYKMVHGFDKKGREIIEVVNENRWIDKIIAVSRIQSVTDKYVRMTYSHERVIYWEYRGGLKAFQRALSSGKKVASILAV